MKVYISRVGLIRAHVVNTAVCAEALRFYGHEVEAARLSGDFRLNGNSVECVPNVKKFDVI